MTRTVSLFQSGRMVSSGISDSQLSSLTELNTWILTTETILVLAACSFGLQVVESSTLVSVLFREAFSHPYIPFFHLLVNSFSVTSFRTFFDDPSLYWWAVSVGRDKLKLL